MEKSKTLARSVATTQKKGSKRNNIKRSKHTKGLKGGGGGERGLKGALCRKSATDPTHRKGTYTAKQKQGTYTTKQKQSQQFFGSIYRLKCIC